MITDYAGGGIGLGPSTSVYTLGSELAAWPDPAVASHVVPSTYLAKKAVVDLAKKAVANGWFVKVTHAQGCYPSVGQRPSRQRHSLAVRMWRGEDRAVAIYVEGTSEKAGWSWDTLYRWTLGEFPTKYATVTPFLEVI
jgi:hypothetical protein